MAKQKTLQDAFYETLKDVYYAEKQSVKALKKSAKAAEHDALRQAFETHAEESAQQSLAAPWAPAKRGCLTPWSEATVQALREAYLENGPGKKHSLNE